MILFMFIKFQVTQGADISLVRCFMEGLISLLAWATR